MSVDDAPQLHIHTHPPTPTPTLTPTHHGQSPKHPLHRTLFPSRIRTIRQPTSEYVSIRQHTSADVSRRQLPCAPPSARISRSVSLTALLGLFAMFACNSVSFHAFAGLFTCVLWCLYMQEQVSLHALAGLFTCSASLILCEGSFKALFQALFGLGCLK